MTKLEEARTALEQAIDDCYLERGEDGPLIDALIRAAKDEEAEAIIDIGSKWSHDVGSHSTIRRQPFNEEVRERIAARAKEGK